MALESAWELVYRASSHTAEITIQELKKGAHNFPVPGAVNYYEGEASFGAKPKFQKRMEAINWRPFLWGFDLRGLADMCCLDPSELNGTNYELEYLGDGPLLGKLCWVYYLRFKKHAKGRHFEGRIWVSPDCLAIVRAEGSFHPMRKILWYFLVEDYWYKFDLWRKEISPGNWVPDFICTGVTGPECDFTNPAFRARIIYHNGAGTQPGSGVEHACAMDSVLFRAQALQPKPVSGHIQK